MRWNEDQPYNPAMPLWTRANAGEVLPLPPSPAGWDLVWANGGAVAGWRDCSINRFGIGAEELDPDEHRCDFIGLFGGFSYLGASWIRVWGERTPGLSAAAMDAAYFGEHPDVPAYVKEPWHENPATTEQMTRWLGWVMGTMEQDELEADRALSYEIRRGRPDLAALTDRQLLERAVSLRPVCRRMFDQHINQSGAASVGPGALGQICAAVGRPTDAMVLIAGLGDVDSAAPSFAMWQLSRAVRRSGPLTAMFAGGVASLDAWLRTEAADDAEVAAFVAQFDQLLAEYGSRGPNEWDIVADTWETDPALALALIDRMRLMDDGSAPATDHGRLAADRTRVAAEIEALLAADEATLGQFRAAMRSAAVFVPGRERSKTSIVRVVGEVRVAMRELGRRTVASGVLDDPVDVCFLFEDELGALVDGSLTDARAAVAERRRYYDWLCTIEPPFIIKDTPTPNTTWPLKHATAVAPVAVGEALAGAPGCPGKVTGRACVVLDPSDPSVLEPGDVLVAPHTDPAWTPLFVPAAAVVVDVGAALSHAIIVSRELGIPCAVSVTDATRRIPHGAMIEVDGDTGVVRVLALPGAAAPA